LHKSCCWPCVLSCLAPRAFAAMAGVDSKGKPLPSRELPASVLRMMAPRQALKAKPGNSSGSKSTLDLSNDASSNKRLRAGTLIRDELPTASQMAILTSGMLPDGRQEAAPHRDFVISLNMMNKNSLGIDVDWADGVTLLVKSVQMGPVADWNMERGPDKALRPGDRIIAVNGVSGETIGAVALVQECKGKPHVQLTCRTQRPRPNHVFSGIQQPYMAGAARPTVGAIEMTYHETPQDAAKASNPAKKKKAAGSLYSFLPEPDPEEEAAAASRAKEADPFAEAAVPPNPRLAIFLDIDGVFRKLSDRALINMDGEVLPLHLLATGRKFESEAVRALKWLVHKTGAGIILSSEWRRDNSLREEVGAALRQQGIASMRGLTPVLEPREEVAVGPANTEEREKGPATMRLRWAERRAREISSYLRERPEVERWVALDDLDLSMADEPKMRLPETLWMGPGLVLIDPEIAFTMGDARKASEMLLKP